MEAFSFDGVVAHLFRDGTSSVAASAQGPPIRIDGYNVGVVLGLEGFGPHRGEVHPDGDELLYIVSGSIEVVVDDGDADHVGTETAHRVGPGEAFIVPRGVWHRVHGVEPAHLVHITPGPNGGHRPP
jgi:mannose-6-phosphate isomerase-like protein (cupin superfamily)